MNIVWALILGALQGLTEFLPISSSGHLVIAQDLIPGFSQPGVLFEVVLHLGTLVAIIIYFKNKILKLTKKYIIYLAVGTIPAAVVGFLFQANIEVFFESTKVVGAALLITALINFGTDKVKAKRKELSPVSALLIGAAQAFAIIPGISRSGSTIFAGTKSGLRRKETAQFSFLLSAPAVLGANILQFMSVGPSTNLSLAVYFSGFVASLVVGYFSIKIVIDFLISKKFGVFAVYCAVLGIIALLWF